MMCNATASESSRRCPHAAGAAIALILLSGFGFRLLAARFEAPLSSVPIPRGTLARLPLEIDDWVGKDVPLDERVVKATSTDDHVNRAYARRAGRDAVSFFLAYGIRLRDLAPHRPEVCYPGAGWTLENTTLLQLKTGDGTILPCQVHRLRRGLLSAERIIVLNYYLINGRYCADVSLLRNEAWRGGGSERYAAQVQIASIGTSLRDVSDDAVCEFARASADPIRNLIAAAVGRAGGEEVTAPATSVAPGGH